MSGITKHADVVLYLDENIEIHTQLLHVRVYNIARTSKGKQIKYATHRTQIEDRIGNIAVSKCRVLNRRGVPTAK